MRFVRNTVDAIRRIPYSPVRLRLYFLLPLLIPLTQLPIGELWFTSEKLRGSLRRSWGGLGELWGKEEEEVVVEITSLQRT